jgi:hypothetical protein
MFCGRGSRSSAGRSWGKLGGDLLLGPTPLPAVPSEGWPGGGIGVSLLKGPPALSPLGCLAGWPGWVIGVSGVIVGPPASLPTPLGFLVGLSGGIGVLPLGLCPGAGLPGGLRLVFTAPLGFLRLSGGIVVRVLSPCWGLRFLLVAQQGAS